MKLRLVATAFALSVLSVASFAQSTQARRPVDSDYIVSAKAGAVNIVQGDATYKRVKGDWDMLIAGDELNDGDMVRTGNNGRLELLMNPGSYLRMSSDAELVVTNTSLDDLHIKLNRGSFILEAANVSGWTGSLVTLVTPITTYRVAKGGLYRFNVALDGMSEALVYKGRLIGGDQAIKDGRKVAGQVDKAVPASFNKKELDEFDLWSADRAKTLVAANRRLTDRALGNRQLGFFSNAWYFSPLLGCYTFLPGIYGYRSPYGGFYGVCNPYAGYPRGGYIGGRGTTTTTSGGGRSNTGGWVGAGSGGTISRPSAPSTSARPSNSGGGWSRGSAGGTISRPAPSAPRGRP